MTTLPSLDQEDWKQIAGERIARDFTQQNRNGDIIRPNQLQWGTMSHYIDTPEKYASKINQLGHADNYIDQRLLSPDIRELSAAFSRGVALGRIQQLNEANTIYRRILERWPTFAPAYHNLAVNLAAMGKFEEAREQVELAIAWGELDAQTYMTAGVIQGELGDTFAELAMYQRAYRTDPQFARPVLFMVITYRDLGWWSVARGWLEIAEAQLRPRLRTAPHLVDQDDQLKLEWNSGLVHAHFKNWRAAALHFELAYKLDQHPQILQMLQEARSRATSP